MAARFKGRESYGPGIVPDQPAWGRAVLWIKPVTRRTMRRRVEKALANPKLERLEIWEVDE